MSVEIHTEEELNRNWNQWSPYIKQGIARYILKSKIRNKQYFAMSLKETELHLALKHMDKALCSLHFAIPPQLMTSIVNEINLNLNKVTKLVKYDIPMLGADQLNLATELEAKCGRVYDEEDIYSIQIDSRHFIHANMRDLLIASPSKGTTLRREDENVQIVMGTPFSIRVSNEKWPSTMNAALTLIMLLLSQMEIDAALVINTDIKDLKKVLARAYCHRYELPKLKNTNFENHLYYESPAGPQPPLLEK
ncbi:12634_t:CDS:2 [Gigaspora margarita]|uniref:12634_t:CDS:1 n=1 Tax=Gigaspora margarita TaxID=4874 RepID=A0ABM8W3Q7_GIGMA|nr:12634_t:CDS:2 [Gigaspora margarita]